jgi:hypothetical protein
MAHIHPTIVLPRQGTQNFIRGVATPAPAAPTLDAVLPGDGQNTILWTKVTGASSYRIYFDTSSGVSTEDPFIAVGDVDTYDHEGLGNGTTYYYKVAGIGLGGHGALSNEDSGTPAVFTNNYSLDFDGINEYLDIANPSNFHFETGGSDLPFSICAWVKMTDASFFRILTKGANTDFEWLFTTVNNDKLMFKLYGDAAGSINIGRLSVSSLTSDEDAWIFLTAVYTGSGVNTGISLYRNAVSMSTTNSSAGAYTAMRDSGDNVQMAQLAGLDNAEGRMDEVSVWDKALSQSEIEEVYNSGAPTNLANHSALANLVSWWRNGDGATFPIIPDARNSNDGTMTNMEITDIVADTP